MGVFHESRIVVGDVGVLALDVYQLIHFELNPMSQKFHLMNEFHPPFALNILH